MCGGMASLGKKCFCSELRVVIEMTEGRKVEAGARRLGAGCKKKSKEADAARYWGKWCLQDGTYGTEQVLGRRKKQECWL